MAPVALAFAGVALRLGAGDPSVDVVKVAAGFAGVAFAVAALAFAGVAFAGVAFAAVALAFAGAAFGVPPLLAGPDAGVGGGALSVARRDSRSATTVEALPSCRVRRATSARATSSARSTFATARDRFASAALGRSAARLGLFGPVARSFLTISPPAPCCGVAPVAVGTVDDDAP
ncbi:MAG: hypothetical protein IVW53_09210 [Chloroflexi bacterium]|nr:hypothetical protein [Chloroflexota bacterium]